MFRKILSVIFAIFMFLPNAHSAEMVNVEYIHQYLNTRWGIDLPYNPGLENPRVAANMKYLLTVVDIANEYLNGDKTTDYGNSEYATLAAADTVATKKAIDTLISVPTFTITTTPSTSSFSMKISAAGNFTIDWGDGQSEVITKTSTTLGTYSHTYTTSGEYEIKLTGLATDYSRFNGVAAVSFYTSDSNAASISKISSNLGKIFPTLPYGSQPRFYQTFYNASNLTEIPADLFEGIHGVPTINMFTETFSNTAITVVPAYLFGELNGNGAIGMFDRTFEYCTNLTTVGGPLFSGTLTPATNMFAEMFSRSGITSVPENIFGNLTGEGAKKMFYRTFYNCTNLTTVGGPLFSGTLTPIEEPLYSGDGGMFEQMFYKSGITSIPENIFGNLNGDGAPSMFEQTFYGCENLTTADGPLFSGTLTPAERMFYRTFYNTALTEIPANLFGTLNGDGAPSMFAGTFYGCENLTTIDGPLFSGTITSAETMFYVTFYNTALTEIPDGLFAGISGAPAVEMFYATFLGTDITEIPADLFAGIRGAPARSMFAGTFQDCSQLQRIPADLFAGIQGAPASYMFNYTFYGCDQLQSIPENLFGNISGPAASSMFSNTFRNCTSLTGPSARINGQYLYEIWPIVSSMYTYTGSTGLSDYDQIPDGWK